MNLRLANRKCRLGKCMHTCIIANKFPTRLSLVITIEIWQAEASWESRISISCTTHCPNLSHSKLRWKPSWAHSLQCGDGTGILYRPHFILFAIWNLDWENRTSFKSLISVKISLQTTLQSCIDWTAGTNYLIAIYTRTMAVSRRLLLSWIPGCNRFIFLHAIFPGNDVWLRGLDTVDRLLPLDN